LGFFCILKNITTGTINAEQEYSCSALAIGSGILQRSTSVQQLALNKLGSRYAADYF
jgi:hypothetical protein